MGWVTDKPGRPLGKVGGRLILRPIVRPSAMRTGASKRDLHACNWIRISEAMPLVPASAH